MANNYGQSFWHEDPQAALVKPVISLSSFFFFNIIEKLQIILLCAPAIAFSPFCSPTLSWSLSPARSLSPTSPALWISGMQLHKSKIKLDHQDDEQSGWRAFEMNTKAGEVRWMRAWTAEECLGLGMNSPHLWIYRFSTMNKSWVEVTINKLFPPFFFNNNSGSGNQTAVNWRLSLVFSTLKGDN